MESEHFIFRWQCLESNISILVRTYVRSIFFCQEAFSTLLCSQRLLIEHTTHASVSMKKTKTAKTSPWDCWLASASISRLGRKTRIFFQSGVVAREFDSAVFQRESNPRFREKKLEGGGWCIDYTVVWYVRNFARFRGGGRGGRERNPNFFCLSA